MRVTTVIHDARVGTLGAFGGWHWSCSCGAHAHVPYERDGHLAIYHHLLPLDRERAERYALEKGLFQS